MEEFALFEAAGIRVVSVPDFDWQVVLVNDVGVLLVADDLTPEEREQAICEYLPTVMTSAS